MLKVVAGNLRNIRIKKNLTQEQVAEHAGINPKYLGEIERCLKSPTAHVVYKLSKALGVPICDILCYSECPSTRSLHRKLACLLTGREEEDIRKAFKILEAFFDR